MDYLEELIKQEYERLKKEGVHCERYHGGCWLSVERCLEYQKTHDKCAGCERDQQIRPEKRKCRLCGKELHGYERYVCSSCSQDHIWGIPNILTRYRWLFPKLHLFTYESMQNALETWHVFDEVRGIRGKGVDVRSFHLDPEWHKLITEYMDGDRALSYDVALNQVKHDNPKLFEDYDGQTFRAAAEFLGYRWTGHFVKNISPRLPILRIGPKQVIWKSKNMAQYKKKKM